MHRTRQAAMLGRRRQAAVAATRAATLVPIAPGSPVHALCQQIKERPKARLRPGAPSWHRKASTCALAGPVQHCRASRSPSASSATPGAAALVREPCCRRNRSLLEGRTGAGGPMSSDDVQGSSAPQPGRTGALLPAAATAACRRRRCSPRNLHPALAWVHRPGWIRRRRGGSGVPGALGGARGAGAAGAHRAARHADARGAARVWAGPPLRPARGRRHAAQLVGAHAEPRRGRAAACGGGHLRWVGSGVDHGGGWGLWGRSSGRAGCGGVRTAAAPLRVGLSLPLSPSSCLTPPCPCAPLRPPLSRPAQPWTRRRAASR